MKTKIITIALIAITTISSQLVAQKTLTKSVANDVEKNVTCQISPTETGYSITFEYDLKVPLEVSAKQALSKKGYDYYQAKSSYDINSIENTVTEVISPRDAASGLATGKRQHKPLTISKVMDKATPILFKREIITTQDTSSQEISGGGAAGKAVFKELTITKRCGGESKSYPFVDGNFVIPTDDCPDGANSLKIIWTWLDGGIEHTDDWTSNRREVSRNSIDFLLEIENGVCTGISVNK